MYTKLIAYDEETNEQTIHIPNLPTIASLHDGLQFLYNNSFEPDTLHKKMRPCKYVLLTILLHTILTYSVPTNEAVDTWNTTVQELNPNDPHEFQSHDFLHEESMIHKGS